MRPEPFPERTGAPTAEDFTIEIGRGGRDVASLITIDSLVAGTVCEIKQDESLATLAPKLSRESTHLDWNQPANKLADTIRGMYPWPGCRFSH